ncbi:hypothetical protein G9A89_014379 [Geosiphon pyriformis]|nr:hypothetical protein G9A89_014379 [Geosiphon pyriformis]
MANTHEYQQCAATLNPALQYGHLFTLKKRKKNLPGKHIKYYGPKTTTTNYHSYYSGMTTANENRKKNLPETLTKPEKLITIKTSYQVESKKKPTREKERKKKKKQHS